MRTYLSLLGLVLAFSAVSATAQAGVDVELTALLGTGVDTGNAPNNPYVLQIGGAAELIVSGYVLGFRATRSIGTDSDNPRNVDDLTTLGADLGYEWELALLHLGPRFGVGQVRERNDGLRAPYIEPGAVAEIELGLFVIGADLRYRVAIQDSSANGLLIYGKMGLRF